MDSKTLSDLIGLIYDAARDVDHWPRLMQILSDELSPLFDNEDPSQKDNTSKIAVVELLSSHFIRACELNREILEACEERNAMEKLFESLPLGMMVVDSDSRVLSCDRKLNPIVLNGNGISVKNEVLRASSSIDTTRLREVIRSVANSEQSEGQTVHLSHSEENMPLSALVMPLGPNSRVELKGKNKVAILVAAPGIHLEISVEILMSLYQLTKAEAKLVSSLVKDRSLNTIAEDFGISKHTIRNQLKSVYEKTGTHRQAELVRQVISGPAMLATIFKSKTTLIQHNSTSKSWRSTTRPESRFHQTMRLPDGRVLGYAEYGNLDGRPAILMHASNGSRLERHPDETIIEKCDVRLIVPDRPGVGLSDVKKNPSLMEWTQDVECLADHLGLEKFSVIGYSLGAAFGAACAYWLKDRVKRLIIAAGITPFKSVHELKGMYKPIQLILSLGKYAPSLLEHLLKLFRFRISPEIWQYELWRNLPPVDQSLTYDTAFRERIIENTRENLRQGGFLLSPEVLVVTKDWGFQFEDIEVPSEIWHGELDRIVPVKMARKASEKIPNCQKNFLPGVGHYILFYCWKEILLSAVLEG